MCMDSTIPRKRLAEMLRTIGEMEGKYALRCVNVFHAGDGNLHPLILFDANDPDEMRRCELFGAEILETSIKLGGTVTGEHGVGVEKLNSMCVQFSAAERAQHAFVVGADRSFVTAAIFLAVTVIIAALTLSSVKPPRAARPQETDEIDAAELDDLVVEMA